VTDIGTVFERTQDGLALIAPMDTTRPLTELTTLLNALCDEAEAEDDRATVVLQIDCTTTQGREWPGDVTIQMVNRWERALRRLEGLAAATIAVARGACGGPALDLLLTADYRIAADGLEIVLPINDGHFWPGMSLYRLVQHLGLAHARRIVMWGSSLPLQTMAELGVVDEVSDDPDRSLRTAVVLSGRVSDREIAVRRKLLLEAGAVTYEEALGPHLAACDRELRRLRRIGDAGATLPDLAGNR